MNAPKGSIWRRWDLHVHTPESHLCNGFGDDFDEYAKKLFMAAIENDVHVIGVTDYFGIWGYRKLKEIQKTRLAELLSGDDIAKASEILLLPNIEFRLGVLVDGNRVNFHVLFSDDVDCDDIDENFLGELKVQFEGNPQGEDDTRKLSARTLEQIGRDLKTEHNFDGTDIEVGMKNAFVSHQQISEVLARQRGLFEGKYLLGVVADEDLSKVSWDGQGHLARKLLIQKSDFLFASNPGTIQWGLGRLGYEHPDNYAEEFKSIKPSFHGSDAHSYDVLFAPDMQRFCWVKADPTFEGLKQVLCEPEDRVFIGEKPSLLERVEDNRTKYIQSLKIDWSSGYAGEKGVWFKDVSIPLNSELVAIIGNKGGGKSAISDIVGLCGDSDSEFSFLEKKKFLKGGLASKFEAELTWESGDKTATKHLDDSVESGATERVKYLAQGYFEALCNELSSPEKFRREIEKVVFQHVPEIDRAGCTSFNDYIEKQQERISLKQSGLKSELVELIQRVIKLEDKKDPKFKKTIEGQLLTKRGELKSVKDNPPPEKTKPKDAEEDNPDAIRIKELGEALTKILEDRKACEAQVIALEAQVIDLEQILDKLNQQVELLNKFMAEHSDRLGEYGISINDVFKFEYDESEVQQLIKVKKESVSTLRKNLINYEFLILENSEISIDGKTLSENALLNSHYYVAAEQYIKQQLSDARTRLSLPEKEYQDYLNKRMKWEAQIIEIEGVGDNPDPGTVLDLEKQLDYLQNSLDADLQVARGLMVSKSSEILDTKKEMLAVYDGVKKSIDATLSSNQTLIAEYPVSVDSSLDFAGTFVSYFLKYVNKGVAGSFYGVEPGEQQLRSILKDKDIKNGDDLEAMLNEIFECLDIDKRNGQQDALRYVGTQVTDRNGFYSYVFSLDYIETHYELRQGGKPLEQLSPGEKGAMLLVFYLLLDRSDIPLVIDQPEDNLDNKSVSKILVPFIQKAKEHRQIIMVTHNPNLAVVADAEQIIRVDIDKTNQHRFSFKSGGIENSEINAEIVDVLEGTMPAFKNRKSKYQDA